MNSPSCNRQVDGVNDLKRFHSASQVCGIRPSPCLPHGRREACIAFTIQGGVLHCGAEGQSLTVGSHDIAFGKLSMLRTFRGFRGSPLQCSALDRHCASAIIRANKGRITWTAGPYSRPGVAAAGDARDAGLSQGAIEQEAQHPDLEHRRPGGAVQGRVRRLPEGQSRRRDRMARQEGSGSSRLLSDPARRRHRAGHRRPPGRDMGGVGGQRRAARPHALLAERAGGRQALQRRLHVELRLREEELPDPVLRRQDAALLQQD